MAELVHASAITLAGRAALIRGSAGTGKSDLALRCLSLDLPPITAQRAMLLADDQVLLERRGSVLRASCPETIAGKLEVRGLGIVELPYDKTADVALVVDMCHPEDVERMPDPAKRVELCGVLVPGLRLAPFEASAPIKLLLALDGVSRASARALP